MDLAHTPAQAPPPGVISNFTNPKSQGHILIIVIAICYSLMLPVVALRVYTRIWISRSFALDDAACILATVGTLGYSAVLLSSLSVIGYHEWDISVLMFTRKFVQKLILVFEMDYGPTVFFAKLSLFLIYLRLFRPSQWTRFLIYFGIVVNCAFYTATTVTFGVLCIPRAGESWVETVFSPRCGKSISMTYIQGIFNVVSDFYLLILPIPVVWQLQMPLRKKIGISAIFMTGLLACIASVLGLYYRILLARKGDFAWKEVQVGSLVVLEMSLGVICGCMPYLASFLKRRSPEFLQLPMFQNLWSQISSGFTRRFKRLRGSSNFNRYDSNLGSEPYLETHILGSVKGAGKFMESGEHPQKPLMVPEQSQGASTIREELEY